MSNEDLRQQIEALRSEVRNLNDSFFNLRDEEVRRVFAGQVRPVLVERIDRAGIADRRCRDVLVDWSDAVLEVFEHDGRRDAMRFIERNSAWRAVRERPDLRDLADGLEVQLRSYLDSYNHVLRVTPMEVRSARPPGGDLSPRAAEAALGPLSNALRISILQRLSRGDEGLASLGRALDLQKGHLQFHLKVLMEGGYIEREGRGAYSLSARGGRALSGLTALLDEIGQ
ncbi:MAG: winged helix-turn-helix transcriptional regulator [Methanomassiliicoccus sp.]|nr:winged helix-turn-helix transcriptional regulator [Methanomassiliicoccus sp.]